jgi:hypothetical protein
VANYELIKELFPLYLANSSLIADMSVCSYDLLYSCGDQNLPYSPTRQRCEPVAASVNCTANYTLGIATSVCTGSKFSSHCYLTCPLGYSGGTVDYICNATGAWAPFNLTTGSNCVGKE